MYIILRFFYIPFAARRAHRSLFSNLAREHTRKRVLITRLFGETPAVCLYKNVNTYLCERNTLNSQRTLRRNTRVFFEAYNHALPVDIRFLRFVPIKIYPVHSSDRECKCSSTVYCLRAYICVCMCVCVCICVHTRPSYYANYIIYSGVYATVFVQTHPNETNQRTGGYESTRTCV